jgi:DNA-binding transcriptional LysR family regulator
MTAGWRPQMLEDMALFVEVAKRKSFSQAAAALGLSVSSLSRRITQFEKDIGARLIERSTRKVALTLSGELYFAQAVQLVEEAQRSLDALRAQTQGAAGFLKVAAPANFWAVKHLSMIVAEFSNENPQIHTHLDLRATAVDLVEENYDIAITAEPPRSASLIARKTLELQNGLFASPQYLLARGLPQHPLDLTGHDVLLPVAARCATWEFRRDDETVAAAVGGRISCNNLSFARRLAIMGQGIAMSSLINVESDVALGRLQRVLSSWSVPTTSIYIVTTSRLVSAKARRFIDFATRRFTATAEAPPGG